MRRLLSLIALGLAAAGCGGADRPLARVVVTPAELELGYPEVRRVELTWEPLTELPGEEGDEPPQVFVHLLDGEGAVVRTFDHPFPARWRVGTPVDDPVELHQSALAPPLPAGRYRLTVGLYRPSGERFPLEGGEEVARREYAVAWVTAAEPGLRLPTLSLTGDWLPVEPGGDRQVLARRWLAGEGTVAIAGATAPGALWMRLDVPVARDAGERLALAPDAAEQEVRVTSPCGGSEQRVTGPGDCELELPVNPSEPAAAGSAAGEPAGTGAADGCPVEIRANYALIAQQGLEQRTVLLEALAWRRR